MTKQLLAAVIGAVLIATIAMSPLMVAQLASADKIIKNECKTDETGKCSFNQEFKQKKGVIKVQNEIDISNSLTGGGNGNVSTVDQEARDRISGLDTEVSNLKNTNDGQDGLINALQTNVTNLETERNILTDRVNQQADIINSHTELIVELNATLQDAIIDIDVGNQTSGGNTTNGNTTQPGGNTTVPVEPVDNQTGPVDNQTGPIDGNVTIPVEGNITIPTNSTPGDFDFNLTD